MNFLARTLLFPRAREFGGAHLFQRVSERSKAHFLLPSFDVNWFARREEKIFDHLHPLIGDENRHLFVDSRDESVALPISGAVSLKTSVRQGADEQGVICIPYLDTVDDFSYHFRGHHRDPEFGASFVGAATSLRMDILTHIEAEARFPTLFRTRRGCFIDRYLREDAEPYTKEDVIERRRSREEFLTAAARSRYMLALPGFGANTSRFFESLSLGVAPILVANRTALPFPRDIPYDEFTFRVEDDSRCPAQVGMTVIRLVEGHWDEAVARGQLARLYYDGYLSRANLLYRLYALLWSLLA
jgi:hypothetical protein